MLNDTNDDPLKDLPALLTQEEAAKFFRVTTRTLRRWASTGRLRVLRTTRTGAGKVLVERAEIRRVIETMREPRPFGAA